MKRFFIFFAVLFSITCTQGQVLSKYHKNMFTLSWEISFPTSNNSYLTKTSLSGGRLEYRTMISDQFSLGLATSWNSFNEHVGTKTYFNNTGGAVTTDMIRTIYTLPMTAIAHYYPKLSNKMIKPYVGVGIGAQYSEQNTYFNVYQLGDNNWGFVVRPEIGTFIMIGNAVAIMVTGSYNYSTNKNSGFDITHLSQFGINLGAAWAF